MKKDDRSDIYQWLSKNRVSESELRDTSLHFRDAYIRRRQTYYQDYKMESSLFDATDRWMRLLMVLWEHDANPEDYISAQFEHYKSGIPPPGAIVGEAGIRVYLQWKEAARKAGPLTAQTSLKLSATGLDVRRKQYGDRRTDLEHIMGPDNPCDALFSWCHLMNLGHVEEAEKFAKLARQLLARPYYRETYSKLFGHILEAYAP